MRNQLYLYVKAFSDLGSMMDMIVLTAVIYESTHSSGWIAASMAVRTLGGLVSSLLSGVMADRRDRRKMMIASDWLRAVCIVGLIVYATPMAILVVSFFIGFLSSYFAVSFSAEVPKMFGEDHVLETNAFISRLSSISLVFGFLGAGILQTKFGFRVVLGLDALSYMASALVLMRLRWTPPESHTSARSSTSHGVLKSLFTDMAEVKAYLWVKPLFLLIFVGYFVETFGASSHNIGIPLLAAQLNARQQALYYGLIWGVWGVGNVLATTLLTRWSWIRQHLYLSYWLSTICMSAGFITFLSTTSLWLVFSFAFLTGIFDATSGTLYSTIMQMTEDGIRGRVFGVSTFLNRLGFGIGFVVAPIMLRHMSVPHMVWWLHGTVITVTILSIVAAPWVIARGTRVRHRVHSSVSHNG